MAEFKADTIGVSTVYELSGLSAEYQERAVEILRENGGLTINDAKALKRQEEAAQQIPGQMAWTAQEVTPPPPPRRKPKTNRQRNQKRCKRRKALNGP